MKNIFKLLIISFLFLSKNSHAQTPTVTITAQVLPPYSTYLPDYLNNPSRIIFTMTSYTTVNVKLKANIKGDNGISVTTLDSYRPSSPIRLIAYQPKMMNGTDLKNYLDSNSVNVTGINKNELFRGSGIPEGTYTICIQALDFNTGMQLSNPEPLGCSNSFTIQQITPPQLISPKCDENIIAGNIQNVIFSWLPSAEAAAGSRYKLKIVELIPNNRNPNEALNSATSPAFFETITNSFSFVYGPSQPPLKKGRKYAWRVTLLPASTRQITFDTNLSNIQNNGNSEVCSFEMKQETTTTDDVNTNNGIKLISPIKGEKIIAGYGLKFNWEASKKKNVQSYELQFTNSYSQDKLITNWNNLTEDIFTTKDAFYAHKETKDLFLNLPNSWTTGAGKIAWRVVALDASKKIVDKSTIETYEIIEDNSELSQLKTLVINGYTIQVTQIFNKDQDKFGGSGKMLLWENGKEVSFNFKDLKIRPIAYFPKLKKYQWGVIDGIVDINTKSGLFPHNRFDLSTQKDCDGTFQLALNNMKLMAKLEGAMDNDNKLFKVTKDLGTTEGKVIGKWFTNWFIPVNGKYSNNSYEFESNESIVKMSFAEKFDGFVNLKSDKNVQNVANGGIDVVFGGSIGDMKLKIKGLEGETDLSGTVYVSSAQPTAVSNSNLSILSIPFKNKKNLNFYHTFDKPLKWKINEEGSVQTNITETYVHLSDNGQIESKFESYNNGLNFDKFLVVVNLPVKSGAMKNSIVNLTFDKIYNKGNGYTSMTNKLTNDAKNNVDIAGFASKLSKSSLMLMKNKLVYLNVQGKVFVPFINDWAGIWIDIDSKKIQGINLDFDYQKKYYLSNNTSGNSAFITVWSGRLENNAIVVTPNITIKNNENKGFETKNMSMCDLYIDTTGAVSYNGNFSDNTESVCEGSKHWATYYKFSYGIDKMKIKRSSVKTDVKFLFSGEVILGPNIASNDKKEMGFIFHGTEPKPYMGMSASEAGYINPNQPAVPKGGFGNIPKGPNANEKYSYLIANANENSIEISDDKIAIQGSYEDGAQKFGGGFKIVQNHPTWGNYFELGGYYEAKEPDCKKLESKLILGKNNQNNANYTYWFFEFYQKGLVSVPIVPGIIEAHGFGGKAYYHMEVNYDNLGKIIDMKPNNAYSLGIAAEADVRTAYDNGATLHGHATLVTQFKGWSIDGINYYIKADAISENSNNSGLLQARLNGQLNWVDKYIDGQGQIWGKVKDIVCINEGEANEDAIFFHFGADDFYLYVGSKENPITAEVMCGSGMKLGVWLGFDTKRLEIGLEKKYDSGWKGLDLGIASAQGRLITNLGASLAVQYSPFQATGKAWFNGRAYGRGCVSLGFYEGCIGGSCCVAANLTVSMPNPVVFEGSVVCDVHRYIPNFGLHVKWSSTDGFDIWV